jgi:hypothetical protein
MTTIKASKGKKMEFNYHFFITAVYILAQSFTIFFYMKAVKLRDELLISANRDIINLVSYIKELQKIILDHPDLFKKSEIPRLRLVENKKDE